MPDRMKKTITDQLHKRMEQCELMRRAALEDLKTLRSEAVSKHDQTSRAAVRLGKQLQDDPDNKTLQREYAGTVLGRKMFHHAAELNSAILKDSENEGKSVPATD